MWCGLPFGFSWFVIVASGVVADWLRSRKILSTTNVRKLANGLGQLAVKYFFELV